MVLILTTVLFVPMGGFGSSPPIVVNGVVVVLVDHQAWLRSDKRTLPRIYAAQDFSENRIPRPGEVGHETWENDAWRIW